MNRETQDFQLLKVDEVAGRLGVSVRTVWRLVSKGELPKPCKIRGCTRFALSDVVAFADRARQTGAAT